MKYHYFSVCDFQISAIGLGLVKIGRNSGVKYPQTFDLPSDQTVLNLIDTAQDLGINLLDTAPAYGESEARLGKLLTNRAGWVICSKVGEEFNGNVSTYNFTKEHINKSVDRSLQRLKTDYIDIMLVHSNGDDVEIIENYEVFTTLENLKKAGKIRSYGMSTKTIVGGKLAVDHSDCVMVTYNINESAEGEVIDYAKEKKKGVLIKKGFASGHANSPEESIKFIFEKQGVTSLVAGTINLAHLAENVKLVNQYA